MEGEGELKAPHRKHLEALAMQGEQSAIDELDAVPDLPPLAAHVWFAFVDLSRTRASGGMGPAAISRLDIRLWEQDEHVHLEPWERRALLALDGVWMASVLPPAK